MTLTRKRLVRVHFTDKDTTIDGIFCGRWAGHYILKVAKLVEGPDRTHDLDGTVRIPCENVLFRQDLR